MLKKTTNNRKMLALMVAGLGLAGCNSSLDIAKQKTPTADVFEKTLYQQYIILSQSEHDEYDRRDGTKFANRAIAAAIGSPSQPEALSARKIPIEFHGELLAARRQLVEALDAGGRQKAPEHAARAQAAFDCWLQEREENFQFDDIQNCQDQFDVAMDVMNAQLRPKKVAKPAAPAQQAAPAPQASPELPKQFTVYFAFDSAELDQTALATVAEAAETAASKKPLAITVAGYADRAGGQVYNLGLSAMRAENVAAALRRIIEDHPQITVKTMEFGETENQVDTIDGTPEAKNRRATISIRE